MNEDDLKLIRDYLDNRIDAEGLERLNRLLECDRGARVQFRAMATLEEGLRDLSVRSEIPFALPDRASVQAASSPPNRFWHKTAALGVAALFLLLVGVGILISQDSEREDDWGDAVARLELVSGDARFAPEHQLPDAQGDRLGKGWVRLERGRVQILFRSGATVELIGPAELGIDTPMRAYLDFGKVAVHAPESARDFVVATESMEVVDLGTRFEVEVDPQSHESNVSVIEGLVDLHLGSRGAERNIRPLGAGYAARVDAFGKIIEISSDEDTGTPDERAVEIVGHWKLDTVGAAGLVEDSAGRQLHGKLHSDRESKVGSGVSGQALEFTAHERVDLASHISVLRELDDFTFSAWVRDPAEPLGMIFSISADSERHRVQLFYTRGFVHFGWQDGLHFDSISGRVDGWESGKWYHVAVSVEGGVARIYRDAELIASGAVGAKIGTPVSNPSLVKNASHAYIGWLFDARQGDGVTEQKYRGMLDDVQLYSGALGLEALKFIYKNPGQAWRQND